MRLTSFRSERGQTASEYMGILLLVAVIIGALISFNVDDKIAGATSDMVDLIAGGGKDDSGGGAATRADPAIPAAPAIPADPRIPADPAIPAAPAIPAMGGAPTTTRRSRSRSASTPTRP